MATEAAPARLAATLVVARDTPLGLELLLLRRAEKGDHNSGAWVFPGGLVDAADSLCHGHCLGLDDSQASHILGLPADGLDFYIAAVRECFEEAGLLFATHADGRPVQMEGGWGQRLAALRGPLHQGACGFDFVCRDFALQLDVQGLHYIGHWVTPPVRPKRFDTRFFLALLPAGQAAACDTVETVEQVWLRPEQALAEENTRRLMAPTRATIELPAAHANSHSLLPWAQSPRPVPRMPPRFSTSTGWPRASCRGWLTARAASGASSRGLR